MLQPSSSRHRGQSYEVACEHRDPLSLTCLRQRDPLTGKLIQHPKWAAQAKNAAAAERLTKARLRSRVASIKSDKDWETDFPIAWLPQPNSPAKIEGTRVSEISYRDRTTTARPPAPRSARFLVRRNELVTAQLGRFWETIAGDKGSIGFIEYVALQLKLHKVLVPPPFDKAAAEREAEEAWAHECPPGCRLLSRHLLQDSLFDLIDQRTRSNTAEEAAEFLDMLFSALTIGCPPAMRKLPQIEFYDIASQAVSNAGAAIRRALKVESVYALSAAKAVGDSPLLRLTVDRRIRPQWMSEVPMTPSTPRGRASPPQTPAAAGQRTDDPAATPAAASGGGATRDAFATPHHQQQKQQQQQQQQQHKGPSPSIGWKLSSSGGSGGIPFAFDSRSAPPSSDRQLRQASRVGAPRQGGVQGGGQASRVGASHDQLRFLAPLQAAGDGGASTAPPLSLSQSAAAPRSAADGGGGSSPALASSLRVGRKPPRLAITLSSKKPSALAGAPCSEPPRSRSRSPGGVEAAAGTATTADSTAAADPSAAATATFASDASPRPTTSFTPAGGATTSGTLGPRPPLTRRPGTVVDRPGDGSPRSLSLTASRGRDPAAFTARTPRSQRRQQQWEQHVATAGLRSATPGASAQDSRRGLMLMRRRDRAIVIPGNAAEPVAVRAPPAPPAQLVKALGDFGMGGEIAQRPQPSSAR